MRHKMPNVGMLAGVLVIFAAGVVAYPHHAAQAVMQLYYVQEMLAALLLFSIGFAVVAVMILILFLLDRGLYRALAWTELYTVHAALGLRRGCVQVGQFGREYFHRSEHSVER